MTIPVQSTINRKLPMSRVSSIPVSYQHSIFVSASNTYSAFKPPTVNATADSENRTIRMIFTLTYEVLNPKLSITTLVNAIAQTTSALNIHQKKAISAHVKTAD